ncbi:DUF6056 family protein [Atlantibacter sp.]|uniref:DUF6056 family protein n=1 Tax=Atlantibacter sp. TaxID=1903473 RepID=UPI002898FD27|nr:DUF6056 family protein [Atlantibacter sp.]
MNVNNRAILNISCLVFIAAVVFFIVPSLQTLRYDDDHYFSTALTGRTLFEYLNMRYHTWSGRIPIEALIALTINVELYWKIAIPVSFFVIAYSLSKLSGFDKQFRLFPMCLVTALMLLINHNVLNEAAWWVTGSYFYLQPIAAGLFSLLIFRASERIGTTVKILSLVLISFACFNEQFSVLVALPYPVLYAIYKKDFSKYNFSYILVVILSTVLSLSAPGNSARKSAEILTWMPDYANLNIIDKITIGLDRLSSHINDDNSLFSIFLAVLLYISYKKSSPSIATAGSFVMISFKLATSLLHYINSESINFFANSAFLSLGDISNFVRFTPYIFSLLVIFSALTLLTSICSNLEDYFYLPLPMILGILSVIVIGFSPTAYASAFRVLFIFNLYIVYLITKIIYIYISNKKD